jgi:hypothetical protein
MYKDGFIVNEIDAGEELVRFANDVTVRMGHPHGTLTEAILRLQSESTVRRHFEKEARLKPLASKCSPCFLSTAWPTTARTRRTVRRSRASSHSGLKRSSRDTRRSRSMQGYIRSAPIKRSQRL